MASESPSHPPIEPQAAAGDYISIETIFDVLAHDYRRHVLASLLQIDGSSSVDDLVSRVSSSVDVPADPDEIHQHVAIMLHHVHLPMMDDAGIIEYNHIEKVVHVTDAGHDLDPYLSMIKTRA